MMDARARASFCLCVLFFCFSIDTRICTRPETRVGVLSVGDSISGDQTLVSEKGGNFKLGFFNPGKTQKYYVGITYHNIADQTIVWVANRDKPLIDKYASQLKLLDDGNLVILDPSKTVVWSTKLSSTATNSVEAALLDSGNFVLRNSSNSSVLVWQSFDHPTNTWLPGGKLGRNKRTNESQLLTSWKNSENPATGLFFLEADPAGTSQYFIFWNMSWNYWTSGTWDGHIFSLVPEMSINLFYDFSYVSNENESYFTYSVKNSSLISRFVMDVSGQIKQLSWIDGVGWNLFWSQPKEQCGVHNLCGAFGACNQQASSSCGCLKGFIPRHAADYTYLSDWSGGCVRNTELQCEKNGNVNGKKDGFVMVSNVSLPINPQPLAVTSARDCEQACLNNCSCNAYAFVVDCCVWVVDLMNMEQFSDSNPRARNIYVKLAASELLNSTFQDTKTRSSTGVIAGATSGAVALLGLVVMLICMKHRGNFFRHSKAVEGSLVSFSYRDLQSATKNFSEKLGGGGFGYVFKGTLPESTVVAVKKLESIRQGEKQFRTEVSTIGTIQHVNLVRLHGFCSEGTKRLLVYDFMPKGSLDSHVFKQSRDSEVLDWKTRYQIATGVARGLTYLHEKCRERIIHCDIKPENILLDVEFCPKVSDFGLAKLVGREFSRVLTTIRGTRGYLAPEWISGVAITTKADVYSYGMMLFEIISGRRNSDQPDGERVGFFPSWAATKINEDGDILSLLDSRLKGNVDLAELTRACKVACWCVQDEEIHRPSMGLVVQILEGVVDVSPPPIPRTLQCLAENHEHVVFFAKPNSDQSPQAQSASSGTPSPDRSTPSSTSCEA